MNTPLRTVAIAIGLAFATACFGQPPGSGPDRSDSPYREPDVPYIPTPPDVVVRMLELAGVGKDDVVYDLGCGDGRIVVTAAKRYGCRAVGIEIAPYRVEESRENAKKNGVEDLVRIERKDLFEVDLSPATVVILYLSSKLNTRLIPQLNALTPGSRIVSHQFEIRGVQPDKVIQVASKEDKHKHILYLWIRKQESQLPRTDDF